MSCPTELSLEQYLVNAAQSVHRTHVMNCAACTDLVKQMTQEGQHFQQYVFPQTVEAVSSSGNSIWKFKWLALPLVVSAAVLLFVQFQTPADDYIGIKGASHLGLSVFTPAESGVVELQDGQIVSATAPLRFRISVNEPCRLWVVSIDSTGNISRLFPTEGDLGEWVKGSQALTGGAVLDGVAGPERLLALCTPNGFPYSQLERTLKSLNVKEVIHAVIPSTHFPEGSNLTSFLLEKKP
jgi:hypothetical protein